MNPRKVSQEKMYLPSKQGEETSIHLFWTPHNTSGLYILINIYTTEQ